VAKAPALEMSDTGPRIDRGHSRRARVVCLLLRCATRPQRSAQCPPSRRTGVHRPPAVRPGTAGISMHRGPTRPRRETPGPISPRSRQTGVSRDRAESALGSGHHVHSDHGGFSVPRRRARCLQPAHRRVIHTRHAPRGLGAGCVKNGRAAAARDRRDPSLGSMVAISRVCIRAALQVLGRAAVDGLTWRCLR
jgi:hypothetical protein